MKHKDIFDYLSLRKIIQNPWAFVRLRKHSRPGELLEVSCKDGRVFYLRSGTQDRHVFHRQLLRDEYGIRQLQPANFDCVIDIGGNVGAFSFMIAPFAQRVLAFEPISENFELMKKNLSGSQFSHVTCFKNAITNVGKDVKIFKSPHGSATHSAYPRESAGGHFEVVSGLSLEDIFAENGVAQCDLLKLDCEGAEYEILFSATDDVMSRISRIIMEYHDIPQHDAEWNADKLRDYLEPKGFHISIRPNKRHPRVGIMHCHR